MNRRGAALLVAATGLLLASLAVPATAQTASGFVIRDEFNALSYSGNDGTVEFTGPWWEVLDSGDRKNGAVKVIEHRKCPSGGCARIMGDDVTFWGTGLLRTADISEAVTATARFSYRLNSDEGGDGYFLVVVFDGDQWTTLDTIYIGHGPKNRVHTRSYNVIGYAAEEFTFGFVAYGDWDGAVFFDDVEISGNWAAASATATTAAPLPTTTTTTTTTTPPPPPTTTTTTRPPTTTTTTRPPTATTTTVPPSPTQAPTTTTTTTRPPRQTVPPQNTTPPPNQPPTTLPPLDTGGTTPLGEDRRYTEKAELPFLQFNDLATMPAARGEEANLPKRGPVTQLMASITVTAVTIRSHLLSAVVLGLLIAGGAMIGLGRRDDAA